MAIAKLPISTLKNIEIYEAFYNYFSKITVIKRDRSVVTFRVQGEGLPADDKNIVLEIYKFEGIKPFVIGVKIFA
ncbi:MAG TPA: hypothetical protein VN726_22235 [Hanamia sp.]|nr:hypothetical protein [Hanamia sp.]